MATNYNVDRQYNHNYRAETTATSRLHSQEQATAKPRHTLVHKGITKAEKIVISIFSVALIAMVVWYLSSAVSVAQANRQVQNLTGRIEVMTTENNNLEQNIQELSRYDRVYSIGEQSGLNYSEDNIRNVE
ncbi:cell division protein FtsL [Dolosigranulum pigrum]|uniref:cell division protein FtsL n=1 Tax=Dolosigranulum pigrum TaxID=29394 RepID=UPI0015EBE301|nr:cell division protein FtsL [Dolosigranulum pigrum]